MSLSYGFLGDQYNSGQFSEVMDCATQDIVANIDNKFALRLLSGLNVNLNTGYAYIAGRWCRSDESITFNIAAPASNADRYDAIALALDLVSREITIRLFTGINPDDIQIEGLHILPLYIIQVVRGASTIMSSNITDKRVICQGMSALSTKAANAYNTLINIKGAEIDRIFNTAATALDTAENDITDIDTSAVQDLSDIDTATSQSIAAIDTAASQQIAAIDTEASQDISGMIPAIKSNSGLCLGALRTGLSQPFPATAWLLCDGSPVPAEYTDLIALIGTNLPLIENDGFSTWIYALT